MVEGSIVLASQEAIEAIGKLREADEREVWAAARMTGEIALRMSFERSCKAWAILADGDPVGVFGVSDYPHVKDQGSPWMLANDRVNTVWKFLLRVTKEYVHGPMMEGYNSLFNFVDAHNKASIRWLKWVGFHISNPVPYGVDGELFHPFWLRRS